MESLPNSPEEISFFFIPPEVLSGGSFREMISGLSAGYLREVNLQSVSISQNKTGWRGGRKVSSVCLRLYEERRVLSVGIEKLTEVYMKRKCQACYLSLT